MSAAPGRIEVRSLTKAYGAVAAVDDLSFTVEAGSITGFLGPNGAGKTTTLRILLGLVTPDSGTATIGGRCYAAMGAPGREVGAVLESSGFHPARSGRRHLRVYCTVAGYPRARADQVLDLAGLGSAGRRAAGGYSLGMRQRLALATALLGDPGVLVLDEPANGLDPEGIAWMRALLRDFAAQGRTVLVSSHLLAEVEQLADHVVIINRGRLMRQGTLAELAALPGRRVRVRTPQRDELAALLRQDNSAAIEVEPAGNDGLLINGTDSATVGHLAFAHRIELHALQEQAGDLEQIFFALTASGGGRAGPALSEVN